MAFVNDVQQRELIDRDILPLQIADIEVALDICNNISGIITAEIDRVEKSANPNQKEIERLSDLRWRFLRVEQAQFTRDNMPHVREFIETYAPLVKRNFETGEIPSFIKN